MAEEKCFKYTHNYYHILPIHNTRKDQNTPPECGGAHTPIRVWQIATQIMCVLVTLIMAGPYLEAIEAIASGA